MIYPYMVYRVKNGEEEYWVAKSSCLKGCIGQGETPNDAEAELEKNEFEWIDTAKELHMEIPEIPSVKENEYSGKITLRFSPMEHMKAVMLAKVEGVSLNQYISDAVSNYNAFMLKYGEK